MDFSLDIPKNAKPIGYRWLEIHFDLRTFPHHLVSYQGPNNERQKIQKEGVVTAIHPGRLKIGEDWLSQLEFAIKHEGIHLQLLRSLFPAVESSLLVEALQNRPTGVYLRKIWYLFEAITKDKLPVPDLQQGNYVDLLDPEHYYTSFRERIRRQRINQNMLGDMSFCGIVRKTKKLENFVAADLSKQCQQVIARFPPEMFRRAMNYLFLKETKSSFEIEHETPDQKRTGQFVDVLMKAPVGNFTSKEALIQLQNLIVDPRFANRGYRDEIDEQIFVGQSSGWKEIVHFAGPKPGDTGGLMDSWSDMAKILSETDDLHPVIAAAIVAFGFVFIHPFSDGNGRIHRFLIHHILAKRGFTPENVIFPVSAVMVKNPQEYDEALESFSKSLMLMVEYEFAEDNRMNVLNETADFYRSIDYTVIAEKLFEFVDQTIKTELPEEFHFLENYDKARSDMRSVVDLPNRIADLFLRLVVQNNGKISSKKRKLSDFEKLTDEEIENLEAAVASAFDLPAPSSTG